MSEIDDPLNALKNAKNLEIIEHFKKKHRGTGLTKNELEDVIGDLNEDIAQLKQSLAMVVSETENGGRVRTTTRLKIIALLGAGGSSNESM